MDSRQYTLFCQQPLRILSELGPSTERQNSSVEAADQEQEVGPASGKGDAPSTTNTTTVPCFERTQSETATGEEGDEDEEDYSTSTDSQTLVRMLEDHEKVFTIENTRLQTVVVALCSNQGWQNWDFGTFATCR